MLKSNRFRARGVLKNTVLLRLKNELSVFRGTGILASIHGPNLQAYGPLCSTLVPRRPHSTLCRVRKYLYRAHSKVLLQMLYCPNHDQTLEPHHEGEAACVSTHVEQTVLLTSSRSNRPCLE